MNTLFQDDSALHLFQTYSFEFISISVSVLCFFYIHVLLKSDFCLLYMLMNLIKLTNCFFNYKFHYINLPLIHQENHPVLKVPQCLFKWFVLDYFRGNLRCGTEPTQWERLLCDSVWST